MKHTFKIFMLVVCLLVACCVCLTSCNGDKGKECDHVFGAWTTSKKATCSEEGTQTRVCEKCQLAEHTAIPTTDHDFQSMGVHAPTCTENGYTEYVCTACGETSHGDFVSKTGHTYQTPAVVAPTCTEDGFTKQICTACGEVMKSDYVAALGHSYGLADKIEPTCTAEGKANYACSRCSDTYSEVLSKVAHQSVTDPAVPATCTATGLTEGSHCGVCNVVITEQQTVDMIPHTIVVTSEAVAPTCTETGLTADSHCSVCETVISVQTVVPMIDHTPEADAAVAPTCTKTGLTEGSHCSVCKAVITEQQTVPMIDHTPAVDAAVAATCTKTGLTEGSHCSVCKTVITKQEVLPMIAHTPVIDAAVAATCTTTGLTEGSHCRDCGEVLTNQTATPVIAHTYTSYEWECSMCGLDECTVYTSYDDFYNACQVSENNGVVRFFYNSPTPIALNLHMFALQGNLRYQFAFGSEAGKCKVVSNGTTYSTVTFEVEKRSGSYALMLSNVSFSNYNTVIRSDAYDLNLVFHGSAVNLQTTKGSNGSTGASYGAFQIGNGGPGGNGANANTVIACNGMLKIICGAEVTVRGGDGGNGGNGGNSDSSGSSGGKGGNGGNGAYAITANDIQVTFADGKGEDNLILAGGRGGSGGAGGKGAVFMGIGGKYAPNGSAGSSSLPTNIDVQYK